MEKVKRILHSILFPHPILLFLFVPAAAVLLIYAFIGSAVSPIVQYLSYFFSAYALTITCVRLPSLLAWARVLRHENKYFSHYFGNAALRVQLSLYGSLTLNIIYALMQLVLGLLNHSVWFYALSAYYFLLALMRFLLLKSARRNPIGTNLHSEYLNYRHCGIVLLFLNLALSVITLYIVKQNRGFSYHYIMTIAMAAHTFFTFTFAIVNVFRYQKYNSPIILAAKEITLAAALVSMLSLETAMLASFGTAEPPSFRRVVTACTGAVVCILTLSMAIYMIVHSTRQLKQHKMEVQENE